MAGSYKYAKDLLELKAAAGPSSYGPFPVGVLSLDPWVPYLSSHPDQQFAAFLRRGFQNGFCIGADPSLVQHSSPSNMPLAVANPVVVYMYIKEERMNGELQEVDASLASGTHCNPIHVGVIPKPHQQGKFKLIVNPSLPEGASVNDATHVSLQSWLSCSILQ